MIIERPSRLVELLAMAVVISQACAAAPELSNGRTSGIVELTCVDDRACGYGTFQSHNQKLVSNANGIFMTYLREDNEKDNKRSNVWRLVHTSDGGKTFSTIYEGYNNCRAPCLETDESGNLYLAHPEYGSPGEPKSEFHFYRFSAAESYKAPSISVFPGVSCAAKYAMAHDAKRKRLYISTQYGRLLSVDESGKLLADSAVLKFAGPKATTQYPHLFVDRAGSLHHAWTTVQVGAYLYWDIHHMLSRDGGATWKNLDGTALRPPVAPDDSGPTLRITLDDEFECHTWLSNFLVKEGKIHFVYLAQSTPRRQHYMRYDVASHSRDVDRQSQFRGESIVLRGLDGFFASRSDEVRSALYCVMQDQGQIGCLASDDNGDTWRDHAKSTEKFRAYSIGGCREITDGGYIIGSFTDVGDNGRFSKVYFFRIGTMERFGQRPVPTAPPRR